MPIRQDYGMPHRGARIFRGDIEACLCLAGDMPPARRSRRRRVAGFVANRPGHQVASQIGGSPAAPRRRARAAIATRMSAASPFTIHNTLSNPDAGNPFRRNRITCPAPAGSRSTSKSAPWHEITGFARRWFPGLPPPEVLIDTSDNTETIAPALTGRNAAIPALASTLLRRSGPAGANLPERAGRAPFASGGKGLRSRIVF